jgi:carbonic anhydrase
MEALPKVREFNTSAAVTPFAYKSLLPDDKDQFYRYLGSLTNPPCSEVVAWTVFKEKVSISTEQVINACAQKRRPISFELTYV